MWFDITTTIKASYSFCLIAVNFCISIFLVVKMIFVYTSLILLCGGTKHTVVSSMENKNRKRECICKQFPVEKRQDFISIGLDYFSDGSHGIQLNGINIHPKPKPKVAFSAIPSTLPCITHISTNNLIKYLL